MNAPHQQLIEALEHALVRVHSGETFARALQGLPRPLIQDSICREWSFIRDRIVLGLASAEQSLLSFINKLKLEVKLRQILNQKTLSARFQAQIINILVLLFALAAILLFPAELKPSTTHCLVAFLLIGVGSYLSKKIYKNFLSIFWFGEWLLLLNQLESSLLWGRTLGQSLNDFLNSEHQNSSLPQHLRKELELFLDELKKGNCKAQMYIPSNIDTFTFRAFDQLRWLRKLHSEGHALTKALNAMHTHSLNSFEQHLALKSEKLSFKLMLPLFCFQFPALLWLLFSPLLEALRGF